MFKRYGRLERRKKIEVNVGKTMKYLFYFFNGNKKI